MKLLIMQLYLTFHYFFCLRSKYFPQHPLFKHPQSIFFT